MYTDDGAIWIDNTAPDDTWDRVPSSTNTITTSRDGKCRFAQHYDTLIFGTDRDGMKLYNPDVSTAAFGSLLCSSDINQFTIDTWDGAGPVVQTSGGRLSAGEGANGNYYYYRFTLDYEYGDFTGESSPLYYPEYASIKYDTGEANVTDTNNENTVELTKHPGAPNLRSDVARINVYRSDARTNQISDRHVNKLAMYYIGSIDADFFNAASDLDVVFTDGGIAPGKEVSYNKMDFPPRGRFVDNHKGRIMLSYCDVKPGTIESWANSVSNEDWVTYPHRVYISSLNSDGVSYEPAVFYTDQFIEIDPYGSGITGTWSYRDELYVVFKANSMWIIQGDDPHPKYGNMRLRNVSQSVGCIAPESICEVEGRLVWLSNSGIYYWDGGSKPAPLKTDNVATTIQAIPDSYKYDVASVYDRKQRELIMSMATSDSSGFNRKIIKFDLRTSAWTVDSYGVGLGAFTTIEEANEEQRVYAGVSDSSTNIGLFGSLLRLNTGTAAYQILGNTDQSNDISFEFQTKHYDMDAPFMDKEFYAVAIDLDTNETLRLDVLIDNKYDTRNITDGDFDITPPTQNGLLWASGAIPARETWYEAGQDENVWAFQRQGTTLIHLGRSDGTGVPDGKRISLIISGDVKYPVRIESITIFYKPLEGVRE
jgi:hypothetical protein